MKALGRAGVSVRWRDIEVVGRRAASDHSVHGEAAAIAAKLGTKNSAVERIRRRGAAHVFWRIRS